MRSRIRNLFVAAAAIAVGGLTAADAAPALAAQAEARTILLRQPAPIAYWPAKCEPTKLEYAFPAKTRRSSCGGKGVLSGPGWWWRAWPGLISGGCYYLSVYDAPTAPSSSSKAQFFPTIRTAGYYDIWVSYRTTHNRADETPFWIFPDDGRTYKMFINEKGPEGFRAVKLGNFYLGLHTQNKAIVEMRNDEGTHSKGVDGIFLKYTGPKNPSGLTATEAQYGDRIVLNWRHQPGVTAYRVYRSTTNSSKTATYIRSVRTSASARVTSFTDTPLGENTTYYYWLRSVGALRKVARGFSSVAAGSTGLVPAAPASVVATAGQTAAEPVVVSWTPVATATSYAVYRAESEGVKTLLATVPETADPLQYSDANVVEGGTYYYSVTAKLAQMESAPTAAEPVTVPPDVVK